MGKSRKRKTLRLTSQQKDDLKLIQCKINHYINIVKVNQPFLSATNGRLLFKGKDHYSCKAQLEYLLHETDIKEEKVFIMEGLLRMERLISDRESDDFGQLTKMALKIQPENSYFNLRKEMILKCVTYCMFYITYRM